MSPYRRARLGFAVAGVAFLVWGLYIWRLGGLTLPWTYQGFAIPVPLHFALVAFGLLLVLRPDILVSVVIFALPERSNSPLPKLVEILKPEPSVNQLPADATATQVADHVDQTYYRHMRRLYGTLFLFAAAFMVALPLVITDQISRTEFQRDSEQLIDLIQQLPLDYSSADHIRAVLRETEPSIRNYPDTAAAKLHAVLADLYAPGITSAKAFDATLLNTYNKHVRAKLPGGAVVIPKSAFAGTSKSVAESPRVSAAYLTTLALLCNEQGNQGEFLPPYLYARQFLSAAQEGMKPKPLAVTSNALGITYSALLRRHDQYSAMFKRQRNLAGSIGGPEETSPLDCVTLARAADDAFSAAVESTTNNFNRSRHLNNRSDLRMWLIHYAHIKRQPLLGNDAGEVQFLRQEVDPPKANDESWKPSELPRILSQLRHDVEHAFNLSPDPRILITRAQLLSLTGQVCDRYQLTVAPCQNTEALLTDAINDVNMARRMGLSFRFFSEHRADELFMSWMWSQPSGRGALSER